MARGNQRWILVGLAAGLGCGIAANLLTAGADPDAAARREVLESFVRNVAEPTGKVFLRLLFMTVLPLVISSLALGVRDLGDLRQVGRIGLKTLAVTLALSSVSVLIGLMLVNTIAPGARVGSQAEGDLRSAAAIEGERFRKVAAEGDPRPVLERVVQLVVPRNPFEAGVRAFDGDMIAVMFFALLFGLALAGAKSERTAAVAAVLGGVYDASIWLVGLAMRLAPVGVAALVFATASRMGAEVVVTLGAYVLTVLAGLGLQQLVVYPLILRFACGVSPLWFFREMRPVMATAFSTSSSNATLPTTLEVARERLNIPPRVANFVLTLGSTFNQNGTALFEGVTVVFLAQFFGVPLSFEEQLLVFGMSMAAGIGTAGVPGGSLPLIVPVLVSVGVPAEGLAVILGVDRFLDMCRTVLNVTGDVVAALVVARTGASKGTEPEASR